MLLSEHVYCVAVAIKMTERVEQQICIKSCIKPEHSSMETIQASEGQSCGKWVIGSFIMTMLPFKHYVSCGGFWQNIKSLRWRSCLQPRFGTLQLLAFLKTKIAFEGEETLDCQWGSGKYDAAADGDWENCGGPKVPAMKGTGVSLPCVQCWLYKVCSSKTVSLFHSVAGYFLDRRLMYMYIYNIHYTYRVLQK